MGLAILKFNDFDYSTKKIQNKNSELYFFTCVLQLQDVNN